MAHVVPFSPEQCDGGNELAALQGGNGLAICGFRCAVESVSVAFCGCRSPIRLMEVLVREAVRQHGMGCSLGCTVGSV